MENYAYVECLINVWGASRNMSHEDLKKYLNIRVRENFGYFDVNGLKPKRIVEDVTEPIEFGIETGAVGTLANVARNMENEVRRKAQKAFNEADTTHMRTQAQALISGKPTILGDFPEYMFVLDAQGISLWPDERQMHSIQTNPENWARAYVYFE